MVQAIQRHFSGSPITWVIGKAEAELVHGLPGGEFLVCDKALGLSGMGRLREDL